MLREEFDDWAVLYNPDTAQAVGVNPMGVAIWKLVDGRRGLDEIIAAVRAGFDEVSAKADDEITGFVNRLLEGGFVGTEEHAPEP